MWQPALDDCGFAGSLEPRSFSEQLDYVGPCDTYSSWETDFLERAFDKGDHKFGLGVEIGLRQARLTIWLLDGNDDDLTTDLNLGVDWVTELDDEGYLYSCDELARFSNDGCCIPLDPLNRAAERARQEICRRLGGPVE